MPEFIVRNNEIRATVLSAIRELDVTASAWTVVIKKFRRKRTTSQNALLHKWFGIIADDTGNTIEDVKEAYRDMFLGKVEVFLGGESRLVGKSTTKLNTQEMSDFMGKIQAHAASELIIRLPQPEEGHLR